MTWKEEALMNRTLCILRAREQRRDVKSRYSAAKEKAANDTMIRERHHGPPDLHNLISLFLRIIPVAVQSIDSNADDSRNGNDR